MPIFIAPLVALAIGLFLGGRKESELGARGATAARTCVAWMAALSLFPAFAFSALYKPSWAWLHTVDPARMPSFVSLLAAAGAAGMAVVGHFLGDLAARRSVGPASPTFTAAIPLAFAFTIAGVLFRRLLTIQPPRRAAEAIPLLGSPFFIALLVVNGLVVVAVLLTTRALDELAASVAGTDRTGSERQSPRSR